MAGRKGSLHRETVESTNTVFSYFLVLLFDIMLSVLDYDFILKKEPGYKTDYCKVLLYNRAQKSDQLINPVTSDKINKVCS